MQTNTPKLWQPLRPGAIVDIIAPASACPQKEQLSTLAAIRATLTAWQLVPRIPENIYGEDLLCANSTAQRFIQLKNALLNTDATAIWCLRGGYGSAHLLPQLASLPAPAHNKLFMGMSDITALHLFLQQQWGWATLHSPSARQVSLGDVHADNIAEVKHILLGQLTNCQYNLTPLNSLAAGNSTINAMITGGNLSIVQTSLGTFWQINAANKILFLEEINERGYRVDRILEHLSQAGIFNKVTAVIFGDFTKGQEPDGSSLLIPVLERFAAQANFPVLRCLGIGHDNYNRPLPLGVPAQLHLGTPSNLHIELGRS